MVLDRSGKEDYVVQVRYNRSEFDGWNNNVHSLLRCNNSAAYYKLCSHELKKAMVLVSAVF